MGGAIKSRVEWKGLLFEYVCQGPNLSFACRRGRCARALATAAVKPVRGSIQVQKFSACTGVRNALKWRHHDTFRDANSGPETFSTPPGVRWES
jgi:hypothetical protein